MLIIDDVISAGTSIRESVKIIHAHGANPAGIAVALDRMERGTGHLSAIQEIQEEYGLPVIAITTLDDILTFVADDPDLASHFPAIEAYRARYGIHR